MFRYQPSIFLALLISLLLLLVIQPLVAGMPRSTLLLSLLSSLLQVAAIFVLAEDRRLRVFAWTFGLPALFAIWARHYVAPEFQEVAMVIGHSLSSLFLAATAILILRFVMTHDVSAHSVFAAVCAYLLIGIVLGHLCFTVETLDQGAYRVSDELTADMTDPDSRLALMMYYSFTTLTTTGFGDIVPNRPLTRTLSWMEAATGQLYLAILIAGVVSMRVNQKITRPPTARTQHF